jgi:hypothetical protein
MLLAIHAVRPDAVEHAIAWISLQPDGAISVGLSDRALVSPRFHARQFIWNAYNRVSVRYLVPHSPHELQAVSNPHLTFHPPIYFHLRANKDTELFAGIAEVEIMLAQDGHVPWVRFVSKPVHQMSVAGESRHPQRTRVLKVPIDSADVSVGVAVDFVRQDASRAAGVAAQEFLDCGQNRLHIRCEVIAQQDATLAWYHQY